MSICRFERLNTQVEELAVGTGGVLEDAEEVERGVAEGGKQGRSVFHFLIEHDFANR